MEDDPKSALGDLLLALVTIGLALLTIYFATRLPPPRYEPLGPAAVPMGVAAVLLVLGGILGLRALRRFDQRTLARIDFNRWRPVVLTTANLMFAAYVLEMRLVRFWILAAVFLTIQHLIAARGPERMRWFHPLVYLAVALTLNYLFKVVLVTNLP